MAFGLSGAIGASCVGTAGAATLLEFNGLPPNNSTPRMDEAYGDNVAASDAGLGIVATTGVDGYLGTPNIELAYNPNADGGSFDSYDGWNGRGAVLQTEYANNTAPLALDFIPSGAYGVLVSSFDLDEYAGGGASNVSWSVNNGVTVIVSGVWNDFVVANGGRSTVNTGMTLGQAQANAGSTITLNLILNAGIGSYQALDNLSFDQVDAIPEPGSALLCVAGLGAAAMRRRRK